MPGAQSLFFLHLVLNFNWKCLLSLQITDARVDVAIRCMNEMCKNTHLLIFLILQQTSGVYAADLH